MQAMLPEEFPFSQIDLITTNDIISLCWGSWCVGSHQQQQLPISVLDVHSEAVVSGVLCDHARNASQNVLMDKHCNQTGRRVLFGLNLDHVTKRRLRISVLLFCYFEICNSGITQRTVPKLSIMIIYNSMWSIFIQWIWVMTVR